MVLFSIIFFYLIQLLVFFYVPCNSTNCFKWGKTFDVPLQSKNIKLDCLNHNSKPVCCAAVEKKNYTQNRGIGIDFTDHISSNPNLPKVKCEITKTYISSPLELRDLDMAKKIESITANTNENTTDSEERLKALLSYVTSDEVIKNSKIWLNRVSVHMQSKNEIKEMPDDFDFLSRFQVTQKCGNDIKIWNEWIEPITITARHPFAFSRCRNSYKFFKDKPKVARSNTDYVLLQSGRNLYKNVFRDNGDEIDGGGGGGYGGKQLRHFMFDAGTSTFDSSLFWFTCGYSQRGVAFDAVHCWEKTLLDPVDYWSKVPVNWRPYWHFYNVPISADPADPSSLVRHITQTAAPSDFVSLKLDVDHPETEMRLALTLLQDDSFAQLVDEFFFELHFRCEVMTSCGWGKRVPESISGFRLDRPSVLQYFIDLRSKRHIRAHIWP